MIMFLFICTIHQANLLTESKTKHNHQKHKPNDQISSNHLKLCKSKHQILSHITELLPTTNTEAQTVKSFHTTKSS